MSMPKKYDTYKSCIIRTAESNYEELFTSDWTFSDIRAWMIDHFEIDESSITEIIHSSVTIYKNAK